MGHVSGAARTEVLHGRSHMPCALAATGSEDTYVAETDTMRWRPEQQGNPAHGHYVLLARHPADFCDNGIPCPRG